MDRYGLTAREMQYLPVRHVRTQRGVAILDVAILAILLAVSIGLVVSIFLLPRTEHAEAAEIHQNDYYCERIKEGSARVVNPEGSLVELCAKWGVAL